jgi:hypothetical protein
VPAAARDRRRAAALLLGAAYSAAAAATTPFSWQADLLTALPIGAVAIAVVIRWPLRTRSRPRGAAGRARSRFAPWVALLGAVVVWELVQYAFANRAQHPTLSSMADAVDRNVVLKAVVIFVWLYLGAAIVRAGTPSGARGDGAGASAGAGAPGETS